MTSDKKGFVMKSVWSLKEVRCSDNLKNVVNIKQDSMKRVFPIEKILNKAFLKAKKEVK